MESNSAKEDRAKINGVKSNLFINAIPSINSTLEMFRLLSKGKSIIPKLEPKVKLHEAKKSSKAIIKNNYVPFVVQPPPFGFAQIESTATEKATLDFFMPLATTSNDFLRKPFMEVKDVVEFVEKNFAVFKCEPTGKYFSLNLCQHQKGILRALICEFRIRYGVGKSDEAKKYAYLLIHNFEIFKDDNLKSLMNNMQPKKCALVKNRIEIPAKK